MSSLIWEGGGWWDNPCALASKLGLPRPLLHASKNGNPVAEAVEYGTSGGRASGEPRLPCNGFRQVRVEAIVFFLWFWWCLRGAMEAVGFKFPPNPHPRSRPIWFLVKG